MSRGDGPVTRVMLTVALHTFSSSTKTPTQRARWHYQSVRTGYHVLKELTVCKMDHFERKAYMGD